MGIASAQPPAPAWPDAPPGASVFRAPNPARPRAVSPTPVGGFSIAARAFACVLAPYMLVAAASSAALAGNGKPAHVQGGLHDLHYGVHLPRNRTLARGLAVARELVEESRYGESLPVLVRVLHAPEDAYENPQDAPDERLISLKQEAAEIIRSLGPEGMRAYHLEVEAQAEREFQSAVEQGDDALADVARRFPRTGAGRLASWALAQRSLEMGHFSKAVELLARLADDADLSDDQRTSAQAQRAIALMALGRIDDARGVLNELSSQSNSVRRLLGVTSDSESAEAAEDLSAAAAAFVERLGPHVRADGAWLTTGGDPRRNPALKGRPPHLWATWRAPTAAPSHAFASHGALGSSAPAPPAATSPLLVGPYVVARCDGGVAGFDRESGKLVWEAPAPLPAPARLPSSALMRLRADSNLLADLVARPRLDAVVSRMSSDGRRVFAISEPDAPDDDPTRALGPLFRVRSLGPDFVTNQLVALDAHAEGKLAWRLGGPSDAAGDLAGAFFLDVPLAVDGELYAVAEFQQTIYLLQLSPESGEVLWRQALASVESPVGEDAMRQMVGAISCYAEGQILVSIGAGMVMAVDPIDRVLRWVYRFPVDGAARLASPSPWRRRRSSSWPEGGEEHWLRNQMLIAGGRAVVASPESQRLHAIDVETGDEAWTSDLPSGRQLCAAINGVILVTTANRVLGVDAASGETVWDSPLPDAARPSGAGVCFDQQYVQPLSDGTVLLLDAATGGKRDRLHVSPQGMLGNVAYDGRSLYSQTADGIARFDPPVDLTGDGVAEAERERLAGELAVIHGNPEEAVEHLLAAYRVSDSATMKADHAAALRGVLLARVTADEFDHQDLDLLHVLYEGREARAGLALARVRAAAQDGRRKDVLGMALEFCRRGGHAESLVPLSPHEAIRPARAYRAAIAAAFGSTQAARMDAQVREALAGLGKQGVRGALLTEVFGDEPSPVGSAALEHGAGGALDSRWSVVQVAARRKSSDDERIRRPAPRNTGGAVFRVPLKAQRRADGEGLASLAVVTEGQWLTGANRYGEEVLRVELPKGSVDDVHKHVRSGAPAATQVGDWLYVATGDDVLALDMWAGGGRADWAWSARRSLERAALESHSTAREGGGGLAASIQRAASADLHLVGAAPLGVAVAGEGVLACIAPQTGVVLWARTDLAEAEDATTGQHYIYSPRRVSDGWRASLVGGDVSPCGWPDGKSIAVDGAIVTLLRRDDDRTTLELVDRRTQTARLSREYAGVVHHTLADGVLAVLDERGRLELIDARACEVRVSTRLDLAARPTSISATRLGDRLVLGVHEAAEFAGRADGLTSLDDAPLVTGALYSFDLTTGESMWPAPALVVAKGVLERQPADSPVVALASNYRTRDASGAYTALNLLMLDAATGRTLYREAGLRSPLLREYHMRSQRGPKSTVTLVLDEMSVTLTATDAPTAPAPPATASVEASGDSAPGDLGWLGRQLGRLLEDGIKVEAPRGEDDD